MSKINFLRNERGDTLVEVMVSIAVLGLVVVGCLAIMNRANGDMLNSIERTEVRTSINSQTEMISYIRDAYMKSVQGDGNANKNLSDQWTAMQKLSHPSDIQAATEPCGFTPNGNIASGVPGSFYVSRGGAGLIVKPATKGRNDGGRAVPNNGLWVDAVRSPNTAAVPYTDFYVKACWAAVNGGVDQQTSTVLRLYDK